MPIRYQKKTVELPAASITHSQNDYVRTFEIPFHVYELERFPIIDTK